MARTKNHGKGRSKRRTKRTVRIGLYGRWQKMIQRCTDPNHRDYHRYGGRGITVADGWQGPAGFDNYQRDIAALPRPDNMSLERLALPKPGQPRYSVDRIDNDGPYAPDNVRWATAQLQSDNQRGRVWLAVKGVYRTRAATARVAGVDPRTASYRQRRGYSAEEATTLPTGGRTAPARDWRDAVILRMIEAGLVVVDDAGFVFIRGGDGLYVVRPATTSAGRYLGLSISIPQQFHGMIPETPLKQRLRSGQYRDTFLHHRIVALFHHPCPPNAYHEVDHVNRDGHDNRPMNLRWVLPKDNRPGGERNGQSGSPDAIDYTDPDQQYAALQRAVAMLPVAGIAQPTVDEPPLQVNLPEAEVGRLVALVQADDDFPKSIWARPCYQPLLPLVFSAAANNAGTFGKGVRIDCLPQVGDTVVLKYVVQLKVSDRVFFGCSKCGRQAFGVRTEIRNRLRHPTTPCESCGALDRVNPELSSLIAADPETGYRRHPSRLTAGSHSDCHFRCRVSGCPNVVQRRIRTLVRDGELPVCEFHRQRGTNFGRRPPSVGGND